jgi:hypothetical protein
VQGEKPGLALLADPLGLGATGPAFAPGALAGEKHRAQRLEGVTVGVGGLQHRLQGGAVGEIGLGGVAGQQLAKLAHAPAVGFIKKPRARGLRRVRAQGPLEPGPALPQGVVGGLGVGPPVSAVLQEVRQSTLGVIQAVGGLEQGLQGLGYGAVRLRGGLGEQCVPGLLLQSPGLFHQLESCRHIGLQRKAAQDVLTQGVESRSAQRLLAVQHGLIQCAGPGRQALMGADLTQRVPQGAVIECQPSGKPFREPQLHLCRGLACEGDRDDPAGARTREQQADDAGDQQPGLAGAGRGEHGGVYAGLGGVEAGHGASISAARRPDKRPEYGLPSGRCRLQ